MPSIKSRLIAQSITAFFFLYLVYYFGMQYIPDITQHPLAIAYLILMGIYTIYRNYSFYKELRSR